MIEKSEIIELLHNTSFLGYDFRLIASSKFKELYFSGTEKIIIQVWNKYISYYTENDFEEEANLLLQQVMIHKPKYIITDQRVYHYQLTDNQKYWYVNEYVPKLVSNGIKKFAIIINDNLIQQVKIEEIIEDVEKYQSKYLIPTRFFSTIAEALQWK